MVLWLVRVDGWSVTSYGKLFEAFSALGVVKSQGEEGESSTVIE